MEHSRERISAVREHPVSVDGPVAFGDEWAMLGDRDPATVFTCLGGLVVLGWRTPI